MNIKYTFWAGSLPGLTEEITVVAINYKEAVRLVLIEIKNYNV